MPQLPLLCRIRVDPRLESERATEARQPIPTVGTAPSLVKDGAVLMIRSCERRWRPPVQQSALTRVYGGHISIQRGLISSIVQNLQYTVDVLISWSQNGGYSSCTNGSPRDRTGSATRF